MADENLIFQIYNEDGTSFNNLSLKKSTYTSIVMSLDDKIEGDIFYVNNSLAFTFKEYIIYNGVKYSLKIDNPPTIVRKGMNEDNGDLKGMTKYSLTFYHPMALLYNIPFTDVAVTNDETKYKSEDTTFYWIGTLTALCAKINKCLQGTSWTCSIQPNFIDDGTQSDVIQFANQMITDVLKTAYDTWKVPYIIDGYKILFGKPSNEIYTDESKTTPYIFKMGQGLGLKNNDRTPKNNTIITRLAGYGSEDNIPSGYPKIKWEGDQSWTYTVDNDSTKDYSYPIIDGTIDGENVKLIKHPYTRTNLMPTIYIETLTNKVKNYVKSGTSFIPNPSYNPDITLIDYYDATKRYLWGSGTSKFYTDNRYPSIGDAVYDIDYKIVATVLNKTDNTISILNGAVYPFIKEDGTYYENYINPLSPSYYKKGFDGSDTTVTTVKPSIVGAIYNGQEIDIIKAIHWINDDGTPASNIDDTLNSSTNKYTQGYFKIELYPLGFDLYAMAAVTSAMTVNMNSGACNGCKFELGVNWDNVKSNFYFTKEDGTLVFDPKNQLGNHRDYLVFPDSTNNSISIIVKKDTSTFGTLMPNIYQQPKSADKFVFLGIEMPQLYIDNKQKELDLVMKQYMKENNIAYYEYPLDTDEYFLTNNKYILNQISPNAIFRFEYDEDVLALSIKEYSITYGEKALPTYKITLTDDISIVLNAIGEVTEGLSKLGSQVVALQGLFGKDILSLLDNYLSSTNDDTANGIITFLKDIIVKGKASVGTDLTVGGKSSVGGDSNIGGNQTVDGNNTVLGKSTLKDATFNDLIQIINGILGTKDFASSIIQGVGKGWNIDALGNSEMESLTIRRFLEVPEIRFNRTTYVQGDTIQSCAGGQIKGVTIDKDVDGNNLNTGTIEIRLEDNEIGEFDVDDICISIFCNLLDSSQNAVLTVDDGLGNRTVKGFATSMFRITSISGERNEILTYSLRGISDRWTTLYHPQPLSTIAQRGNFSKAERQSLNISGIFPKPYLRIMHDVNYWEFSASMIGCQFGNMENLAILGINMTGYSAYLNNIYMNGTISQFESIEPKMTFNGGGDNQIAEGQTKLIKSTITNGYGIDITDKYPYWQITRDTGDVAADNIWNAQATIENGEFYLTYSSTVDDLGGKESALYTVTASDGISKPITEIISL